VAIERAGGGMVGWVRLCVGAEREVDLLIDCGGLASVLQGHPDTAWQSWDSELLCDAAVVLRLPSSAIVPAHTKATALSAGWCWDIPLTSRRGLGYVFSTKFQSAADATQELLRFAGVSPATLVGEPRVLSLHTGRRSRFWVGNVLSLGLAAGFAEPLESSGLHLTQVGIERFMQLFPSTPDDRVLPQAYNESMASVFDEVRDFIQLHYHLNDRSDAADPTGFWTAARDASLSDDLRHRLKLYDEVGELPLLSADAFGDTSYFHLLTGSGRLPARAPAEAMGSDSEQRQQNRAVSIEHNRTPVHDLAIDEQ